MAIDRVEGIDPQTPSPRRRKQDSFDFIEEELRRRHEKRDHDEHKPPAPPERPPAEEPELPPLKEPEDVSGVSEMLDRYHSGEARPAKKTRQFDTRVFRLEALKRALQKGPVPTVAPPAESGASAPEGSPRTDAVGATPPLARSLEENRRLETQTADLIVQGDLAGLNNFLDASGVGAEDRIVPRILRGHLEDIVSLILRGAREILIKGDKFDSSIRFIVQLRQKIGDYDLARYLLNYFLQEIIHTFTSALLWGGNFSMLNMTQMSSGFNLLASAGLVEERSLDALVTQVMHQVEDELAAASSFMANEDYTALENVLKALHTAPPEFRAEARRVCDEFISTLTPTQIRDIIIGIWWQERDDILLETTAHASPRYRSHIIECLMQGEATVVNEPFLPNVIYRLLLRAEEQEFIAILGFLNMSGKMVLLPRVLNDDQLMGDILNRVIDIGRETALFFETLLQEIEKEKRFEPALNVVERLDDDRLRLLPRGTIINLYRAIFIPQPDPRRRQALNRLRSSKI